MSLLVVEAPGLQTTVQDFGRQGFGVLGVSASGAADAVALRLGNLLLENPPDTPALEMTLTGGTFLFPDGAVICLAGANFGAQIDGKALELWRPHAILPGKRVAFGATRDYARCYLCVAGGIDVVDFLGSASTHLLSGLGGWEGRALRKGDVLQIGRLEKKIRQRKLRAGVLEALKPGKKLRVTQGSQLDWFSEGARRAFLGGEFVVSEESNRIGLRLDGPWLAARGKAEMISEGTPVGAIQVTPSGQAILLFVEQQTTGGYPKIANVIGADLHSVGQLRPRDTIRFEEVSFAAARKEWIEQQQLLESEERLFA
ncbi:MAG TPA: biotin-dependent carboxyltransferase family protein [Candidatus Baltobacteraceae bacterium]|nr:biotin-dependent carboxyltransferase family protein [Candidatus Baltobacteraceae bacterium]